MFAPKVAKPQTKAAESSTTKLSPGHSALVGHRLGEAPVEDVLLLQRTIGNQATLRLLARGDSSLTGSEPRRHDFQEGNPGNHTAGGISWNFSEIPLFPPEQASRTQPSFSPIVRPIHGGIQAKLVIGEVNDPLEHEADRVADQVMRMGENASPALGPGEVAAAGGGTQEAPAIVDSALTDPGLPLDSATRAFFEPRFGYDFSKVRTHTDGTAASAARSIGATAFAVGQNIAFGAGQFRPGTAEGRKLIAHELAHVVQQGAGVGPVRRQSSLDAAIAAHDYQQIAELLNGYNLEGIQSELAKRSRGFAAAVYSGAIENKRVGPDSAIAQATRPAYLDINYENEVARKDWQAAAFYLNGFNAKDIIDRLSKRTTEEVQALRDGAVAHPQIGPGSQLARLAGDEAARRERQGKRPPEPGAAVPMGGSYEDYAADPDYVDNFSGALYDPFSKSIHVFYPDGGEAVMPLPIGKTSPVLVFERKSFLDTPTPKDFKVYPTILTPQNIPHIADWLADHKEEMEQSDLLLQAGVGSLQARSLPPDLWWLAPLAPAAGLGARLGASRMRPAFKNVQPEEGEIPVIRTPTPPAPAGGAGAPAKSPKSPAPVLEPREPVQANERPTVPPRGQATKPAGKVPEPAPAAPAEPTFGKSADGYSSDRIFRDWVPAPLPAEGWKLHVSPDGASAKGAADAVLPVLRSMGVGHKVVSSAARYGQMSGTQAGKFITIYPRNPAQAQQIVNAVDAAVAGKGLKSVGVAGEKRVGTSGLVYTRYGGFTKSTVTDTTGKEVPDVRGKIKPDWIADPWAELATPSQPQPSPPRSGSGNKPTE